jgi:hypothetical protein
VGATTPFHVPGIAFFVGALLFLGGLGFAWRPAVLRRAVPAPEEGPA